MTVDIAPPNRPAQQPPKPSQGGWQPTPDHAGPALLVCSSGGHLTQLLALRPWWSVRNRMWVTSDSAHARSALRGEAITWGHFPVTRHAGNLVRNSLLALRLLLPRSRRPSVIISTGAGVAVPFFVLGRLMRIPTVYIEVFGRVDSRTLTGRLCHPFTSLFLVQWEEQHALYRKSVLAGELLWKGDDRHQLSATRRPPNPAGTADPLVLVTLGTDHHPFPRVIAWVDRWLAAGGDRRVRTLIQYGATPVAAGPWRVKQLDYEELQEALGSASVVITHAGATAMEARSAGHIPLIVPRRPDLGEHVDGHQIKFSRWLETNNVAVVCDTEQKLHQALDRAVAAAADDTSGTAVSAGESAPADARADKPAGAKRAAEMIDALLAKRASTPTWPDLSPEPVSWPPVTVIVPTLGTRPDLLERALNGIRGQNYPGTINCLVVLDRQPADAGSGAGNGAITSSRDGSAADERAATRAVASAARARVIDNQRTPGLAGSRNTGVLAAEDELVAFCDDDDAWLPCKLRAQVAVLAAHPAATLVCCGIAVEYAGTVTPRVHPRPTVTFGELLRSRLAALHPSTFVARRSALLNGVGLVNEEIPGSQAEDYELLLRAARRGPVLNVPRVDVRVRWHTQRSAAMHANWPVVAKALPWLLDHYPEFRTVPAGHARIAGRIAFAAAASGDRAMAWRWAWRTIRTHPRELRPYLALGVVAGLVNPERLVGWLHRHGRGV